MLQRILQPIGTPKHDQQVLESTKLQLAGRRALPPLCAGRCRGPGRRGQVVSGMARTGMAERLTTCSQPWDVPVAQNNTLPASLSPAAADPSASPT